jgi:LytS/YehU family sensor histidine kinase
MIVYNDFYKDKGSLFFVTLVYAISHGGIYYLSQYVLVPQFYQKDKGLLFLMLFLGICTVMGLFMYASLSLFSEASLTDVFQSSFSQVLFVFVSSNVFVSSVLLAIKSFIENRKIVKRNELIEKERLQTELAFLKSQVNPHFLFNTINSIYVLIKMDPKRASDTLIKLSNLLRSQLYEFNTNRIPIARELEYLENYLALEKTRKGERVDVRFEVGKGLEGFFIAPLIMIPFLENCFKHLSNHADQKNSVHVKLKCESEWLYATFYNTREIQEMNKKSEGGLGLVNIMRRLELLYPNQYQLSIQEEATFYQVDLTIAVWK